MTTATVVPQKVDALSMAFGGDMKQLLPPMSEIPDQYKSYGNKWCVLVSNWFFRGLKKSEFVPKEGVDRDEALRHIKAILGSFEPKHEHKEAACAYLLALWFKSVQYENNSGQTIVVEDK
jgi:hypothetical protein